MRTLILFLTGMFVLALPFTAFAKTDKFDRAQPEATPGADGKVAPKSKDAKADEKIDVSGLEGRYWTAKDNEFSVVQNRVYTKTKKFSFTPTVGSSLNDTYSSDFQFGLDVDYYLSEHEGVEMQIWKTSTSPSSYVTGLAASQNVAPNFNTRQGYVGVSYVWIPIYGKMSLLDKRILYFDMSVSGGLGATFLQSYQFAQPPTFVMPLTTNQMAITGAIDIGQQFFINERFAIRIDLRNHFFPETVYSAGVANLAAPAQSGQVQQKFTYDSSIMIGFTIFQ